MLKGSSNNRKRIKYILIPVLLVVGFVGGWYGIARIISPWTVVKTIQLEVTTRPETPAIDVSETLRVGCYNIAHGRGGKLGTDNWNGGSNDEKVGRLKQIGRLLAKQQLDMVVLNEVDFSSFWSGHIDQSIIIAREAGYPYIVQQRNVDVAIPWKSLRFGNVILSKYPISMAQFLDFPNPSRFQDIFVGGIKDGVAATITLPDKSQVQVVAVHLSLEGETTRNASVEILLDLQRQSGLPMIAMGDFNSTANGMPHHRANEAGVNCIDTLMASEQLITSLQGSPVKPNDFTFPSEKPTRMIDWIFVSPCWEVEEKIVLQTNLSDHLPVMMALKKK